mmetsp:Transcript_74589/g.187816  ORF Transcript_74589/g.187816 Transcript_74589/m.187816 type:complete len:204 (+) Transcript_74589:2065-2676(+)
MAFSISSSMFTGSPFGPRYLAFSFDSDRAFSKALLAARSSFSIAKASANCCLRSSKSELSCFLGFFTGSGFGGGSSFFGFLLGSGVFVDSKFAISCFASSNSLSWSFFSFSSFLIISRSLLISFCCSFNLPSNCPELSTITFSLTTCCFTSTGGGGGSLLPAALSCLIASSESACCLKRPSICLRSSSASAVFCSNSVMTFSS